MNLITHIKQLSIWGLVLGTIILSSCAKTKQPDKYIPRDAAMVATFDLQELALNVADLNLLFDEHMFWNITPQRDQTYVADTSKGIPLLQAGINIIGKFYLISGFSEGESPNYLGLIFPLSDHRDFRKFAASRSDQKMTVSPNNVHYTYLRQGGIIGWNKEVAVYLVAGERRLDRTLEGELFRIFSLREDHQLVNYFPSFKKLQEKSFDIGFWMNLKHMKNSPFPIARYFAQGTLEEGTYSGVVNFVEGAIDISTTLESPSAGDSIHILKNKVDLEVWDHIAGESISAVACLGLDMETIHTEFKNDGILNQANNYLGFLNITMEDLMSHLSGDLSGIILEPREEGGDHRFFVEIGMKDPEVSDKIVGRLKELGLLHKEGQNYKLMNNFTLVEKEQKLLFTNDDQLTRMTFDPASQATQFKSKAEQNSLIFYLHFPSIPDYLLHQYGNQLESFSLNVDELESIEIIQGALEDRKAQGTIKIQFLNHEENSLSQIVNYVQEMYRSDNIGA